MGLDWVANNSCASNENAFSLISLFWKKGGREVFSFYWHWSAYTRRNTYLKTHFGDRFCWIRDVSTQKMVECCSVWRENGKRQSWYYVTIHDSYTPCDIFFLRIKSSIRCPPKNQLILAPNGSEDLWFVYGMSTWWSREENATPWCRCTSSAIYWGLDKVQPAMPILLASCLCLWRLADAVCLLTLTLTTRVSCKMRRKRIRLGDILKKYWFLFGILVCILLAELAPSLGATGGKAYTATTGRGIFRLIIWYCYI